MTILQDSTNIPRFSTNPAFRSVAGRARRPSFFFFKLLKRKKKEGREGETAPTRASTGFSLVSIPFPNCLFFHPRPFHVPEAFFVDSMER